MTAHTPDPQQPQKITGQQLVNAINILNERTIDISVQLVRMGAFIEFLSEKLQEKGVFEFDEKEYISYCEDREKELAELREKATRDAANNAIKLEE